MNETNNTDKRVGKKAIGHTPHTKWARKKANKKSRSNSKKELANLPE